jgi:hypothetical protein
MAKNPYHIREIYVIKFGRNRLIINKKVRKYFLGIVRYFTESRQTSGVMVGRWVIPEI